MSANKLKCEDVIDGVIRTADGRLKIKLFMTSFPLTCREGDVIDIQKSDDEWQMYWITDDVS